MPRGVPNSAPADDAEVPDVEGEAPGEANPLAEKLNVKATKAILVFDPYTGDYVGEAGGEMRNTQFVRDKIAEGLLEKI